MTELDDMMGQAEGAQTPREPSSREVGARAAAPYVRAREPHRTQAPINDLAADESADPGYSYESGYTYGSSKPIAGSTYRRSRSDVAKVQRELKYGRYLSVPKGNHEIFGSQERLRRRRAIVIAVAVAVVLLVVLIILLWPR